jgi:hypothetical protein
MNTGKKTHYLANTSILQFSVNLGNNFKGRLAVKQTFKEIFGVDEMPIETT